MEVLDNTDEAPCCRVCHGESEPDNQLFFPCKCDGSIKYVHQPCLEQWLKVTGKTNPKCELCGEPFQFQKVYKSDAPYRIALYDVFLELIPRGWNLLRYAISVAFACVVWAAMLPLFTNWWLKACWCFISDRDSSCFSNIPSFIENQSTEGFMTFWYFGVVDVCIVIAASVISFEVGHTVYKEYTTATNKQKIRFLERRLAANQLIARAMHEESQKKERCLFAISDYETLKNEWDLSKKAFEQAVGTHAPSSHNVVSNSSEEANADSQQETTMPTPSVADRFLMVQSLASDERYCVRLIVKLDAVCEVTDQNVAFVNLRETYRKLLADLQKTNAQCAALIGLLPASFAADQLELASTRVKQTPVGPEHFTSQEGVQTEPPTSSAEVPWYEHETGIDVDTLEPTMDNLELRVNLLMRRQLREEAQQAREKEALLATSTAAYFAHAEKEDEEEELELEMDDSAELQTDPAFDYAAEWRRLHEEQETDQDAEGMHPRASSSSSNTAERAVDSERHAQEKEKGTFEEVWDGEEECYEKYEQEHHDFTAGETDDAELEVAQVVENLVSYVEFAQCDVDFEDSSGSDSEETVDESEEPSVKAEERAMERDALGNEARVNTNLQAPEEREPQHDELGAAEDAGEEDGGAEVEEIRVGEVEAAEGGIVEVQIVNPPPNLAFGVQPMRFNEPFLHVQHMALAYGYVGLFVVIALVIPALLGDAFFSYTAVGQLLTTDLRRHILTALDTEESFHSLVKLLEYLEFSTERLEMNTDKELAAQIVLTQVRAMMNLAFGYAVYTAVPVLGLTVCYVQYIANIDYSGNAFDVVGVVTRQARAVQGMLDTGVKMTLLMIINGVALPIAITFLTAKFMDKSLPSYLRAGDLDDNPPVLLIFGLFIFSHLFIAHVRHVLYELRQVINKKYLVGILPDSTMLEAGAPENVVNVHDRVSKLTYSEILKNTMIRMCFLLPAFVFGVVLPVRLGHWCFPLASPLMFRLQQVTAEVQIPVEMMLSHIFIPLIVDKLRYKSIAKQVVSGFVTFAAELLQLTWILEPPAVAPAAPAPVLNAAPVQALPPPVPAQDPQVVLVDEIAVEGHHGVFAAPEEGEGMEFAADRVAPLEVGEEATVDVVPAQTQAPVAQIAAPISQQLLLPELVRLFLVVASGLLLFAFLSSWLLHGPLTTGRWLMKVTHLPTHNDLFNYPVGLLLCWGFGFLVQYIVRDIYRNTGAVNALRSTAKWLSLTAQMLGVGLLWLGLPPLILGVLLEALFVVPLRVSVMETSYFPFLQNWAFGLIILKAFCKLLLSGLFGELELRNQMEMVVIRGFAHFDAAQSLQRVVYPILLHLLDLLLVPYFIARCLCMVTPSYYLRTLMVRYCFHVYIAALVLMHVCYHLVVAVVRLHNEVRDSKYLIGTKLTNRA